jgi:uncharacterized repeat protein (TIGR01451 family)
VSIADLSRGRRSDAARRMTRAAAAALTASLLVLAVAASARAIEPVAMGVAHDYSVLGAAVTSTGATAMSDDLGSTAAVAGTPIVLGLTHIGTAADAAKADMNLAYADALLRPSTDALPANLGGASVGPGVYNAPGAMGFTAGTAMTLTGDQNAVFIFQIGGALSIGAGAQVNLVGGARACNVFWQVNGATTIGASSKFAGTVMASSDITVGADTRVDGRVLSTGAITLASNAIRTACTTTALVAGPAGPVGPAGPAGVQGIQGATGPAGPAGTAGVTGVTGAQGLTGASGGTGGAGASGLIGLTGLTGAAGSTGLTGTSGLPGPVGPAGVGRAAETTTLCVTDSASRGTVRQGGLVRWTIAVTNCGAHAAFGVSVTQRVPEGATIRAHDGGGLIDGRLTWRTGKLDPGERKVYKVATRLSANMRPGRYVGGARADAENTRPAKGHGSIAIKARARAAHLRRSGPA